MYTPLIPTEKPKISYGVEIRIPSESDSEGQESNEIVAVEYPRIRKKSEKVQNPVVKIKLDVEIIIKKTNTINNIKCIGRASQNKN